MKLTTKIILLSGLLVTGKMNTIAQVFVPSPNAQTLYPNTGTAGLNLDRNDTKYLSNFSFPGSGSLTGNMIQIAGWSTDNAGGFSYGITSSVPPYTYTGKGAQAIPNARDVQVGFMKQGANSYIIAAYYDVEKELYAYDLYSFFAPVPSTVIVTKLYTYHFEDPDFSMPEYIPTSDYDPSIPGSAPGTYPAPVMTSKMGYNRIAMDINIEGNKVAIVMTNNDNGYMYLATGEIAIDTVIFSPNLPGVSGYPAASTGATTEVPIPVYTCTFSAPWIYNSAGAYWDYQNTTTGIYVRYFTATNEYHYSYYPIDRGLFITVVDASDKVTSRTSVASRLYNPLIGIMGHSLMTTPGLNRYFTQLWPDVCFNGNYLRMVFYVNNPDPGFDAFTLQPKGAEDLYVTDRYEFDYFYDYTGPYSWVPGGIGGPAGPNHMEVTAFNTFDKKTIRESPTSTFGTSSIFAPGWSTFDFESLCKSLPLLPGEEMRARIDAPDNGTDHYAITFAYSGVPTGGYRAFYPKSVAIGSPSTTNPHPFDAYVNVHNAGEAGKKNIYVRNDGLAGQAILTNGSIKTGHVAINNQDNIAPSVAYNPLNTSAFSVAWISERAAAGTGNIWSYIGVHINSSVAYGASGYLVSPVDYLRIPANSSLTNYSGAHPLVSLSKRNDGMSSLYTCFAQEQAAPVLYSIQHKNHPWSSAVAWRPTGIAGVEETGGLSLSPNPFENTLHLSGGEGVLSAVLSDIAGRSIFSCEGTVEEINGILDRKVPDLVPGAYIFNASTKSGTKNVFKITKR